MGIRLHKIHTILLHSHLMARRHKALMDRLRRPLMAHSQEVPMDRLPKAISTATAMGSRPLQYIRVLTKPSAQTFAQEMGKASWDIVWVELIIYAIIATILSYLRASIFGIGTPVAPNSPISPATMQAIQAGSSIGLIVLVPIGFFIGVGIYYALAKAFHGQGTFLQQGYTQLLISVPIGIASLILEFIPILGSIAAFALGIYAIVLNVFSIMAVHRLSGGKATWVVLIPVIVAFVLACVLFFVFIAAILAMMRR